jgi:hypothetical protein
MKDGPVSRNDLSYQEFLDPGARLHEVDFPIERDPAEAWPDFVAWRLNYKQAAYAVAFAVDAVLALWSGPAVNAPPPSLRSGHRPTGRPASCARRPGALRPRGASR